jgi:hypothetical protein
VHVIKLPNWLRKMVILKIIILADSETKSKSKPLTVPFYGNPLKSVRGCIQIAVTIVVVTGNVCVSKHWKDEQVA